MDTNLDLERRIDRELSRLPLLRAPLTLLPRVLAAIGRPWYARAWLTWPAPAQLTSGIALVGLVAGVAWLGTAVEGLGTMPALVRIGWRHLVQPAAVYLFAIVVALPFLLAVSWAAINRVALGGVSE